MGIQDWLKNPSRGGVATMQLRRLLMDPSCWPRDPELARLAAAIGPSPAPSAGLGTALIVSVSQPRAARATLYRLRPHRVDGAPPWQSLAESTASRIWESVTRDLPIVVDFSALEKMPPWSADLLHRDSRAEDASDRDLDGDSYGAAFLLASASILMQTAVPTDLVALACVGEDGRTGAVGMLDRKIECVLDWSPGVARIAVHAEQKNAALAVIARRQSQVTVHDVRDAKDIYALAFPHAGDMLPASLLTDASARKKVQDRLFLRTVQPKLQVTDWSCLSRTAVALLRSEPNDIEIEKLTFVRSIADRHAGETGPFVVASDRLLENIRHPTVRSACIAQSIQALTDGGPFDAAGRARLESYEALLESDTEEQLALRGALGRAWAAQRQYGRARETLVRAVDVWTELDKPEERSRALCELVRVQGILGDGVGVARSRDLIELSIAEVGSWSACFQLLTLGRSLVLLGRFAEALATLDRGDVAWPAMPPHVRDSRTRWKAAAVSGSGERRGAAELRVSLDRADADPANRMLSALDALLESGNHDAIQPLLDQFATTCRQAAAPLLQAEGTNLERAVILAREYPY